MSSLVLPQPVLDFHKKALGDGDIEALCSALTTPACVIKELILSETKLSFATLCRIIAALKNNLSVTKLDLSGNGFGNDALAALADMLQHNHILQHIEIRLSTKLGVVTPVIDSDAAVDKLVAAVQANSALRQLNLSGMEFSNDAATKLIDAIKAANETITHCSLGGAHTPAVTSALAAVLNKNKSSSFQSVRSLRASGSSTSGLSTFSSATPTSLALSSSSSSPSIGSASRRRALGQADSFSEVESSGSSQPEILTIPATPVTAVAPSPSSAGAATFTPVASTTGSVASSAPNSRPISPVSSLGLSSGSSSAMELPSVSVALEHIQSQLAAAIPIMRSYEYAHAQSSSDIALLKSGLEREAERAQHHARQVLEAKEKLSALTATHSAETAQATATIASLQKDVAQLRQQLQQLEQQQQQQQLQSSPRGPPPISKQTSSLSHREMDAASETRLLSSAVFSLMNYKEDVITAATNNFSTENILGKGKWGTVFRGELYGTDIAVKRLPLADRKEFEAEISALCHFRHPNIVQILGVCKGKEYRCLVLELMQNGTLRERLDCPAPSEPLSWLQRRRIALDVAKGMEYLQNAVPRVPMFHLDLKSMNILLDANSNAKIADFGLTRPVPLNVGEQSFAYAGNIQGTIAYVCPEYLSYGRVSKKTDVYSFGIVLLELLTGRSAEKELKTDARRSWKYDKSIASLLDPKLQPWSPEDVSVADKLAAVTFECVDESRLDRPSFTELIPFLKGLAQGKAAPIPQSGTKEAASKAKDRECIICCSEPISCQFRKCYHSATCEDCAKIIIENDEPCPVCRCVVESYVTGSFAQTFVVPQGETYVPPPIHRKAIPKSSSTDV